MSSPSDIRSAKPNDSDSSSEASGSADPAGGTAVDGGFVHGDWCGAHGCLRLSCTLQGRHQIGEPEEPSEEDDEPFDPDTDEDWKAVMAKSHDELVAELEARGVDVPAFVKRVKARVAAEQLRQAAIALVAFWDQQPEANLSVVEQDELTQLESELREALKRWP